MEAGWVVLEKRGEGAGRGYVKWHNVAAMTSGVKSPTGDVRMWIRWAGCGETLLEVVAAGWAIGNVRVALTAARGHGTAECERWLGRVVVRKKAAK